MNREKWTLYEKKKFLRLLSKYDIDDYQRIARHLPNKSAEDVKLMIETQVKRAKYKEKMKVKTEPKTEPDEIVEDVPAIDKWLKITQGLVNRESLDFSTHLSRVMSIISDFETFPSPDSSAYRPNYREIYRYLGELLSGNETHELKPLESAVMLEVLHSLLEVLAEADTAVQRNIMKWKYQLIAAPNTDSKEKMKYSRKVVENDFTDFIRHKEETGEQPETDSEDDSTDELLPEVDHEPAGVSNNVGSGPNGHKVRSARRQRGRPRKTATPSAAIEIDETGNEVEENGEKGEMRCVEGITWTKTKEKPHIEFEGVDKDGRVVIRRSDRPGVYVQIKPEKAELTDKKQLAELRQCHQKVVKRKEYTYRPPPKEPEVVLVMPPVNKPVINVNVKDRNFRCSRSGKYKSLGKSSTPTMIHNKQMESQDAAEDNKERVKKNESLDDKERIKRYNATINKFGGQKLSAQDIEEAKNYRYEPRTARKELQGHIRVKLPVKSCDGNIAVEFPVANIERTGNIHVQLSASNIESPHSGVRKGVRKRKSGSVTFAPETEQIAINDQTATNTDQETNVELSDDPPIIEAEDVSRIQQSATSMISEDTLTAIEAQPTTTQAPPTITEATPNVMVATPTLSTATDTETQPSINEATLSVTRAIKITEALPTITEAPPTITEAPPTLAEAPTTIIEAPTIVRAPPPVLPKAPPESSKSKQVESQANQETLHKLAEYVRSKSSELAPELRNKKFRILKPGAPIPPGAKVMLIKKPSGSITTGPGTKAAVMPSPGPASSVMLKSGPPNPITPAKKLSTLTFLPSGQIISTSEGTETSELPVGKNAPTSEHPKGRSVSTGTSTEGTEISKLPTLDLSNPRQPVGRAALMTKLNATVQKRMSEKMVDESVSQVGSSDSAIISSSVLGPGQQFQDASSTESSHMLTTGPDDQIAINRSESSNTVTTGSDNQIVLNASDLPVVSSVRGSEKSGSEVQISLAPSIEVPVKQEKRKKKRTFDKTRYTAFVKDNELTKYTEKAPKKPKLYSLNPFCVPISLLDIGK